MNCLKCGCVLKEDGQVFCPDCLANMAAYPVKPGTPIQLPVYAPSPVLPSAPARRKIKPEDQIPVLNFRIRVLMVAFLIALGAFFAVALLCLMLLEDRGEFPSLAVPSAMNLLFHVKH